LNSAHNSVTGNTLSNNQGAGMELVKGLHNTVSGNLFTDNGGADLNLSIGSHSNVISQNTFRSVLAYSLGVYYYCNNNIIAANSFDSRFDLYTGMTETRAPESAIHVAQYVKNLVITDNVIKGYRKSIYLRTTMYPGVVGPTDPEYYLTGYQDVLIRGNSIQAAYQLEVGSGSRAAMPQNTLYGIYFHKNTGYDRSDQPNVIEWEGLVADGNIVDGVEYPFTIHEETATAPTATLRFTDTVFQNNKAINSSSATGIPNYPIYVNTQLDKYLGIGNSWNYIAEASGDPALTSLTLWGYGETVKVRNLAASPATGRAYEYTMTSGGTWARKGRGQAAPTTYTWNAGDIVTKTTGTGAWTCTVGGTSGTWVAW
jgi:parallel beta-helix repeat protein